MIEAQRTALLAARREGTFTSAALTTALENLDAEQISIELRSRPG
jgi:CPA1 family monovalent cation:H+ antiporter